MARIIAVTDEALGVEARIFVDTTTETGEARITRIELSALEGHSICSTDLLLFHDLGLDLPNPAAALHTTGAILPPPPPAPVPVPVRRDTEPKVPYRIGKGGRTYYERPDPQELMALYAELGSYADMARHYGIDAHIVVKWVSSLRKAGYSFPQRKRNRNDSHPTLPNPQ